MMERPGDVNVILVDATMDTLLLPTIRVVLIKVNLSFHQVEIVIASTNQQPTKHQLILNHT